MVKKILQELGAEIKLEFNNLYIVEIDPTKIVLLKKNARFVNKDTMNLLIKNIKKDSCLTSMPLLTLRKGELTCISGNHRIIASIEAKIGKILCFCFKEEISNDDFLRLQLSHNSLVGTDEKEVLLDLLKDFELTENIEYTGIDDNYLKSLNSEKNLKIDGNEIEIDPVTLYFNRYDIEDIKKIFKECQEQEIIYFGGDKKNTFENLLKIKDAIYNKYSIINMGLCLKVMLQEYKDIIFDKKDVEKDKVLCIIDGKKKIISKEMGKKILDIINKE